MPRTLDRASKETLGKNLAEARLLLKWTQGDAAEHSGVRRDRISRWESGRETPGAEGLLLLAIAYGVSVDRFFSGVDERYDLIIERRLPLDAARHYKTRLETFIQRQTAAMQLVASGLMPVPTPAKSAGTSGTASGKSSRVRVRRGRGK